MKGHDKNKPKGLSRRSFLKGAGGVIGASALGSTTAQAASQPAEAPPISSREGITAYPADGTKITLNINGSDREVEVKPSTTLLRALREKIDLTGSKEVCNRGACGACTVLMDGRSVNACMVLAIDAVGSKIVTVEGLAQDGRLDAVQAAFVENDACQCGFCIPGFVVRTRAFLDENPKPSMDEIKKGLSGNICRCGAYVRILDAAAQAMRGGRA